MIKVLKLVGGSIIDKPLEIIGRQFEFYQQRKNSAQSQQLKQEEARFMQQLEFDRQKFNAELDDMIARREIERGSLIAQTISDYQKTMAECTISIGKSLGMMNIELRERATALVENKQKQYSAMQDAAMDKAAAQLEKIYAKFPEESILIFLLAVCLFMNSGCLSTLGGIFLVIIGIIALIVWLII